jgi:hypothetical protein
MTTDITLLDRALAVVGTGFAWLPIVATVVLSLIESVDTGTVQVDWLMPAGMFVFYGVGAAMLVLVAIGTHRHRRLVVGSVVAAVVTLLAAQGLALVSGLASGQREPSGWPWALALVLLAVYTVAVIATGIAGVRLSRDLLRSRS